MTDLPHTAYITAVCEALADAGLDVGDDTWLSDSETRGSYCYLGAVITLDPSNTRSLARDDVPADAAWPHGLILTWEWHTGAEAPWEPERGPVWEFAEMKPGGPNEYPTGLPVYGYASPAAVVEAARKVVAREIGAGDFYNLGRPKWDGDLIGDSWEHADQLDKACEAWGAKEIA